MRQTFKLKKGEILFDDAKIIIKDDAKKRRHLTLLSSSAWTIYGTVSVLRHLKTGDQFLLWTGLFIGIAYFVVFLLTLRQAVESEISMDDIKSLKIIQKSGNENLDIKLKNSKLRPVVLADNETELEEYIETIFRSTWK